MSPDETGERAKQRKGGFWEKMAQIFASVIFLLYLCSRKGLIK